MKIICLNSIKDVVKEKFPNSEVTTRHGFSSILSTLKTLISQQIDSISVILTASNNLEFNDLKSDKIPFMREYAIGNYKVYIYYNNKLEEII